MKYVRLGCLRRSLCFGIVAHSVALIPKRIRTPGRNPDLLGV
jgi:hypothetical protein